jgi:hypothetical protein
MLSFNTPKSTRGLDALSGSNILRMTTGRDAFDGGGGALAATDLSGNSTSLNKDHDPGGGSHGLQEGGPNGSGGFGPSDLARGTRGP